ncbi:hypothetical protein K438DRAFT_1772186 [Mycena galopus ATCC 62051]|nr:hypothetical protein K438DRAFT_1772186 [Mycena galopus ATCC 62051]
MGVLQRKIYAFAKPEGDGGWNRLMERSAMLVASENGRNRESCNNEKMPVERTPRNRATEFTPGYKKLEPTRFRMVMPPPSDASSSPLSTPATTLPDSIPIHTAGIGSRATSYKEHLIAEEPARKAWNKHVSVLKAAAGMSLEACGMMAGPTGGIYSDADPTNWKKAMEFECEGELSQWRRQGAGLTEHLAEDYALDYGHFVSDDEVFSHVMGKTAEELRVAELCSDAGDFSIECGIELWLILTTKQVKKGCPFQNPDPIERYEDAARKFKTKYVHPLRSKDVGEKSRQLTFWRGILMRGGDVWDIVGQQWHHITFVNPFDAEDDCRMALDNKLREQIASFKKVGPSSFKPTVNQKEVSPWSVACQRRHCQYGILEEDLARMQQAAEREEAEICGAVATRKSLTTEEFGALLKELFGY